MFDLSARQRIAPGTATSLTFPHQALVVIKTHGSYPPMGRDDVVRNFSPEHPEKVLCVASRRQTLIYAYLPVRGQERAATADLSGLNSSWTRAVDTDNTDVYGCDACTRYMQYIKDIHTYSVRMEYISG